MLLACQSACVHILMPCWQDSSAWLRGNLNCNEETLNELWMCGLLPQETVLTWQSVTSIRCSNSADLLFSSFWSKVVPVAAVFCNAATLFYCVPLCYFRLNEQLLGFVFFVLVRC